jgi:hypothetical protein
MGLRCAYGGQGGQAEDDEEAAGESGSTFHGRDGKGKKATVPAMLNKKSWYESSGRSSALARLLNLPFARH